jgi:DNA invertase Pin-like site-specific DNA recombinase
MNPLKFILYCRKSTESDDRQVLSLDSQEKELLALAEKLQIKVVKVFRESKSAKAPGRPVFDEMMKIFDSGKADAILCWKIDRLTRNPLDGGRIQWLLQNNKIKCIQTFEKCYYPNDNVLLMSIEQAMANQYIRDLAVNVKRGQRAKLEKGWWPGFAKFGYKNDKANKTIVVDEYKSKYVIRAFELYATGSYGFKEIANILFDEVLRTGTGKKICGRQCSSFDGRAILLRYDRARRQVVSKQPHTSHFKRIVRQSPRHSAQPKQTETENTLLSSAWLHDL